MSRRRIRPMVVLYSRHFCNRCDGRVFPYDSLEKRTEAPGLGARGAKVLLHSANALRAKHDPDDPVRVARCWHCQRWTQTYRETLDDIMARYLARAGVTYRRTARQQRRGKLLAFRRRSA